LAPVSTVFWTETSLFSGEMENQLIAEKAAGASTREMAKGRYRQRLWVALFALACLASIQWAGVSILTPGRFVACMLGLAVVDKLFIPCLDWLKWREGHASRGAQAEETVGAILNRLPENCIVLHDLNTGRGNIDHVVFCQDGAVFLIETKSHRGTVSEERGELRRNGRAFEKDFLKQTHGNVFWLRDFLKVRLGVTPWIDAAIVFPSAYVTVRGKLSGVDVINSGYLEKWMARASGNAHVANKLWPQIGQLQNEISHP
jgi:hypothetical protein